jgi:hypothetical protein
MIIGYYKHAGKLGSLFIGCTLHKFSWRYFSVQLRVVSGVARCNRSKNSAFSHAGRLAQLCDKSVSTKSAHTQG